MKPNVTSDLWRVTRKGNPVTCHPSPVTRHASRISGFTMVEIAICLAIIGIALVAIIGVLPIGINVQKDNREETVIDQDASVFIENIRNGARGLDDLTNYVFAISNSWTLYNQNGTVGHSDINGYTYANFSVPSPLYPTPGTPAGAPLTNGMNIIGLLSTPEYIDPVTGAPLLYPAGSYISNYVVAYVRSLSGPAVEKPPQDNDIVRGDSFSYKMISQNVSVAVDTNFVTPYSRQLTANLREVRLTFLWPLLQNGGTGNGRQTFRTSVGGQVVQTSDFNNKELLYFFQPQSFVAAP
jgi:prepilin-type N-terminal cleavage/methylation domain-containing protein